MCRLLGGMSDCSPESEGRVQLQCNFATTDCVEGGGGGEVTAVKNLKSQEIEIETIDPTTDFCEGDLERGGGVTAVKKEAHQLQSRF